jgi:hypothetical protein
MVMDGPGRTGEGALLKPIIDDNGKIVKVEVMDEGNNYSHPIIKIIIHSAPLSYQLCCKIVNE